MRPSPQRTATQSQAIIQAFDIPLRLNANEMIHLRLENTNMVCFI
jgi:hypothetical protein